MESIKIAVLKTIKTTVMPFLLLVAGFSLSKTTLSFGHIACGVFGGGLFAFIAFWRNVPKSNQFAGFRKYQIDPSIGDPFHYTVYRHPALDQEYYSSAELYSALEHKFGGAYQREREEHTAGNLYGQPILVSILGILGGIFLNEELFHIQNLVINIAITVVGTLLIIFFIYCAEQYRSHWL